MFFTTGKWTPIFAVELCHANHWATDMKYVWISGNNIYLILNSRSVTLLPFHFNTLFVPRFHTHFLEKDQLPMEPKQHSPNTLLLLPLPSNKSSRYMTLALSNPVTPARITTIGIPKSPEVKFFYSLIEPAYGYEFHALAFAIRSKICGAALLREQSTY